MTHDEATERARKWLESIYTAIPVNDYTHAIESLAREFERVALESRQQEVWDAQNRNQDREQYFEERLSALNAEEGQRD